MTHAALHSSKRQDWATPPELFATLDAEFTFDLDAAADERNAKTARYYTQADDALTQPWSGRVYVNPPYGRGMGRWVEKAICSSREGATVVMLVPARTDSIWFQQLIAHADEIRFLAGRVVFEGATEPAPFPNAVCVLRPDPRWTASDRRVTFSMPTRHAAGHPWRVMRQVE